MCIVRGRDANLWGTAPSWGVETLCWYVVNGYWIAYHHWMVSILQKGVVMSSRCTVWFYFFHFTNRLRGVRAVEVQGVLACIRYKSPRSFTRILSYSELSVSTALGTRWLVWPFGASVLPCEPACDLSIISTPERCESEINPNWMHWWRATRYRI